jgi:hypothetical protein
MSIIYFNNYIFHSSFVKLRNNTNRRDFLWFTGNKLMLLIQLVENLHWQWHEFFFSILFLCYECKRKIEKQREVKWTIGNKWKLCGMPVHSISSSVTRYGLWCVFLRFSFIFLICKLCIFFVKLSDNIELTGWSCVVKLVVRVFCEVQKDQKPPQIFATHKKSNSQPRVGSS